MRRAMLLAGILLFTAPAQACSGKIASLGARAPLTYNPFAPADTRQEIAIKLQNTGSDRCAYQLSIPDRYMPLQFTPNLRFSITAGGAWQGAFLAVTPILPPGQSREIRLTLTVYRGQTGNVGTVSRQIGFSLTPAGNRSPVDEVQLTLSCHMPPILGINLAGSGRRTSMEFSSLNANTSRSVVMQTRATQNYRLDIQSTAGRLLREGSQENEFSTIPFVLSVDGQTYALSKGTALHIQGRPGESSHLLSVKIGDTKNKVAGIYKATITVHIASGM